MLNFRYHIVSLVAVFLALGIGVIMGSAVIDRVTIDVLEDQEQQLRDEIGDLRTQIEELEGELGALRDQQQRLADEGSEVLLDGRLDGVPVALIAPEGAGGEAFDALTDLLTAADAQVLGTVRLGDRLSLPDEAAQRELAQVLGRAEFTAASALRRLAMEAVASAFAGSPDSSAGTASTAAEEAAQEQGEDVTIVAALADAGFLQLEPGEGLGEEMLEDPPAASEVILVWPEGSSDDVATGLLMARALAALPLAVVAAEETPEPASGDESDEERLSLVQAIRADTALSGQVSTVDNLDQFSGRLATVLALDAQGRGEVGHFGAGEGSQRLLPPAPEPVTGG